MDTITMRELESFLVGSSGWHVSLYMQTHRAYPGTEQDPIRLGNLLREAEERLLARGLRSPDVRAMLEPAQNLLEEPVFWQNQSQGLAVFLTPQSFHFYRLPLPFKELVVVSHRFHLKPLLPFFASNGHFYILALSQNQVRLLEGTRYTVDEIDLESMPESMAEALQFERLESHTQVHSGSSSEGAGDRAGMFHGQDPSDEHKNAILRWFQQVDDELPTLLVGRQSPIVLAGVEYLLPLYKEANSYPHLLGEGITGNPEELRPEELHDQAWPLVQPFFSQAQKEAGAQFRQLAGTGQTTTDVAQTVVAAHNGRIDVLFVALGVQTWGSFDPATNKVHLKADTETQGEDLLDLAAVQTILNGGTVYAVEPDEVPEQAPLAAVFRY